MSVVDSCVDSLNTVYSARGRLIYYWMDVKPSLTPPIIIELNSLT